MGLIDRAATSRVHALIVPVPGHPVLRMRVEAAVVRRGWRIATGPADADLLVTAGAPGPELAEVIERVWDQVPRPRWRCEVETSALVETALQLAAARLLDRDADGDPSLVRPHAEHEAADMAGHDMAGMTGQDMAGMTGHDMVGHDMAGMAGHDMGGMTGHDMAGHDMAGHDMAGHDMSGMGGHGMDMSGPGGIPLAMGDEGDRDQLEMDVLHLPLGPVLPEWPAGLVVECTLRGDVIAEASARVLHAGAAVGVGESAEIDPGDPRALRVAVALDDAARMLRLAGVEAASAGLLRARDALLAGASPADQRDRVASVRRRVGRSLLLRWGLHSLQGGGGIPALDARARLLSRLDAALALIEDRPAESSPPWSVDELARQLPGRGLAAARLLIAASGVDTNLPRTAAARD